jgi:hypothetical protein
MLIATCVLILLIWYYYQPQFLSTKNIVLNVAIMAIYLFVYNRLFDAYKELDNTDSNAAYLKINSN